MQSKRKQGVHKYWNSLFLKHVFSQQESRVYTSLYLTSIIFVNIPLSTKNTKSLRWRTKKFHTLFCKKNYKRKCENKKYWDNETIWAESDVWVATITHHFREFDSYEAYLANGFVLVKYLYIYIYVYFQVYLLHYNQ